MLRVENASTAWTSAYDEGQEILIPLKNGEGGFVADADTLDRLEGEGRVVFRYVDVNPNGSLRDIAGITNERGNVVGLMPHPEHAVEDLTRPGHRRARLLHICAGCIDGVLTSGARTTYDSTAATAQSPAPPSHA